MAETASINMPDNLIKPIIEAEIKAAIIRQLGNSEALIGEVVKRALNMKVDRDGKECSYGDFNLLEMLLQRTIRNVAKEAMEEWVKEKHPQIKKQLADELSKRKTGLASLLVDGLANAIKDPWRLNVKCCLQNDKD